MFNYLATVEQAFIKDNSRNLKTKNARYFDLKATQLKQMFVPFSSESFSNSGYKKFLNDSAKDLKNIFINITSIYEFFQNIQKRNASVTEELRDLLLKQLLSPIVIAAAALDLSINLAIFTLGLFTRSLASIYYMINYKPVDEQQALIATGHDPLSTDEEEVYSFGPSQPTR